MLPFFGIRLVSRSSVTGHRRVFAIFVADGPFLGRMLLLIPHDRPFLFGGYVVGADGTLFLQGSKRFLTTTRYSILDTRYSILVFKNCLIYIR